MRAPIASTLLALAALIGCTPEGRCAIDSDCPIRSRCVATQCTAVGASDAAERPDASASLDAYSAPDAPAPDAPVDAPVVSDANADAPLASDTGVSCPVYAPNQNITAVRGCTGVTATALRIEATPGADCAILIDADRNITGTMMLVGGTMTGNMSIGMLGYPACTLTSSMLRGQHVLTCGACSLTLADSP